MCINLKYVAVFLVFVLLILRNIENLLSTRAETSSDLFCRKWQVFSWCSVRGKLNLKQQNFPGREIPSSGGSSNTGCSVFSYILCCFLPPDSCLVSRIELFRVEESAF